MERISRDQMLKDWGHTGVQNATVLDLIRLDAETDTVVLLMIERRPWGSDAAQLRQIEEKINRYMAYALDGFLVQHHPQYQDKPVRLQLDCVDRPDGTALRFVNAARLSIEAHGLQFTVNINREMLDQGKTQDQGTEST